MTNHVAQAFPTPTLREVREGGGTQCVAGAGEIEEFGIPTRREVEAEVGLQTFNLLENEAGKTGSSSS
jgi:hypothetical protein